MRTSCPIRLSPTVVFYLLLNRGSPTPHYNFDFFLDNHLIFKNKKTRMQPNITLILPNN